MADDSPPAEFVHEMDTEESEEAACSWRALQDTLLPPHGTLPCNGAANGNGQGPPPRFGLHVNGAVFGGWVRQSSPACAAASVAGAWNALAVPNGRHGRGALRQDDVLVHLRCVLEEQIAAKRARFERLLGGHDMTPFEAALDEAIAADPGGKTLGGKSKAEPGMKRGEAMKLVVAVAKARGEPELARAEATGDGQTASAASSTMGECGSDGGSTAGGGEGVEAAAGGGLLHLTCFGAIAALVREDEVNGRGGVEDDDDENDDEPDDENVKSGNKPEGNAGRVVAGKDEAEALCDALASGVSVGSTGKKTTSKKKILGGGRTFLHQGEAGTAVETDSTTSSTDASERRWDWRSDLWEILKKRGGLEKLNRPKPSTGEFGNWGIAEACNRVSAAAAAAAAADPTAPPAPVITSKVVIGVKTKARKHLAVALSSKGDQAAAAEREWCTLRELFARDDTVILFHLKNHYALVYALREQSDEGEAVGTEEADGDGAWAAPRPPLVRRRELLTARRGQRPAAWISWEEARATMLRWTGYGMMAVTLKR